MMPGVRSWRSPRQSGRLSMRCRRCRGLMVQDRFMDLGDDMGHIGFLGWRCVNCGEVVDPVVLAHRIERPMSLRRGRARHHRVSAFRTGPVAA